jgi:hypothetical protein
MEAIMADDRTGGVFDLSAKIERSWENLDPPRTLGDALPDELYHAVGTTLSSWENVEECCAMLLMAFTQAPPESFTSAITFRAFGSGQSGVFRREAVEHAGEGFFAVYFPNEQGAMLGYLRKAIQHVAKASKRRDEVAHGRVLNPPIAKGWLLLPPMYNTKLTTIHQSDIMGYAGARYRHNAQDLRDLGEAFNRLANALSQYRHLVLAGKPPILPPPPPPTKKRDRPQPT